MTESDANGAPTHNPPAAAAVPKDTAVQPTGTFHVEAWEGPLPPPAVLEQYDALLPGAAARMLDMAESSYHHQLQHAKTTQEQEGFALETTRKVAMGDVIQGYLGVIFAFIIAMTGLAGGVYLSAAGRWEPGLAISLSSLAGLVGVFVYGTRARSAERRRNAANRPPEEE